MPSKRSPAASLFLPGASSRRSSSGVASATPLNPVRLVSPGASSRRLTVGVASTPRKVARQRMRRTGL